MSVLAYLKRELAFGLSEWTKLSDADKDDLKRWAREEMEVLGVAVK